MIKLIENVSNYIAGLNSKKIILFCGILICFAYINSLSTYFILDDYSAVVSNMHIRELKLSNVLTPMYREVNPDKFKVPIYSRPIQILSYAIDYRIWKLNPFGYHLMNMILHILNAILIFVLFSELFKNKLCAFFGALLFGVHPVFTSAVTYISGRADVLLLLFSLLMVICFIKSIKTWGLVLSYYILSLLCFVFVLGSKETGFLSVLFLIGIDKFIYRYSTTKIKNLIYVPYIFIFLTWQLVKPVSLPGFVLNIGGLKNILFMFVSMIKGIYTYAILSIIPYHLRMGRSITVVYGLADKWFYVAFFLLLVSSIAIVRFRKNKLFLYGLLWFCVPLFIQLLFNYFFARNDNELLLPEHNLYFSYVGFLIILFSFLLLPRIQGWLTKYIAPVFVIIILCYTAFTVAENVKWGDEIRLFNTMLEYNNNSKFNYMAYANLGYAYERIKNFERAETNFKLAAETSERNPYFYNIVASFYIRRNNLDKALDILLFSRDLDRNFYQTNFLLGIVYAQKGLIGEARENFKSTLLIDPSNEAAARYLELLKDK